MGRCEAVFRPDQARRRAHVVISGSMRSPYLFHGLLTGLLIVGCAKDDAAATEGGSGTESGSDTDTGDTSGSSNSGGNACIPGISVACSCPDGGQGAQVCAADGKSFGACECEGSSGSDSNATSSPTDPSTDPTNVTVDPSNGTTTDATTTDATTTTGGSTTTTDGSTTADTTGGGACEDPGFEPNEDVDDAEDLGDQACAAMEGSVNGVLDGDADIDWSVFHSVDSMACGFNNPVVGLSLTATDAVRMCVFADCDDGNPQFMCPMGTMFTMGPNNTPGCCGDGDMTFGFNCQGTPNESANFFIRLDEAPADACVDYTVVYTFGPA